MAKIVCVDNGKTPDEPYNARLGFWLPPDTPYGNSQLKLFKLSERIDELNRKIIEAYALWERCISEQMLPPGVYHRHVFVLEQVVFLMRRAADELIAFISCLNHWEQTKTYPKEIEIDCIGAFLEAKLENRPSVFQRHIPIMRMLNDIANAYKHSFINSDHTLLGRYEPCIHALGLKRNKLSAGAKFYNVSCAALVNGFNELYQDAFG